MKVFVANFGLQNYAWKECYSRSTVATMNRVEDYHLWKAGDKEGYIEQRMKGLTAAGIKPTKAVASRWFNLMTNVSESRGDIWIHRDGQHLWWTTTSDAEPTYEEITEPVGDSRRVIICHKPCTPWLNKNKMGATLYWNALHVKAKDFLFTESTMSQLSQHNALYALALINGEDLSSWHNSPEWKKKQNVSSRKTRPVSVYNNEQKAAYRMASTAFQTANQSGKSITKTNKDKDVNFSRQSELEAYILTLLEAQERHCALTAIPINLDESAGDSELRASLDRIDSSGHYEKGNLQIVCKFANRWKSAEDNDEFKRLVDLIRHFI